MVNQQSQMIRDGLKNGLDEKVNSWVSFPPFRYKYFLPNIKRQRTMKPVFNNDGTVSIEKSDPDPELGDKVDKFLLHCGESFKDGQLHTTLEAFGDFMNLVKSLLQKNYNYSDDVVAKVLTMNERDLGEFISAIMVHCHSN